MGNCSTCRFWMAPEKDGEAGFCRRNPPQAFMMQTQPHQSGLTLAGRPVMSQPQIQMTTNFPPTRADVWCGEWEEG